MRISETLKCSAEMRLEIQMLVLLMAMLELASAYVTLEFTDPFFGKLIVSTSNFPFLTPSMLQSRCIRYCF
uniref:Secreted protein n=1 Tax=Steinernema glaseri TaxID=37863 RepID=A0A1I7ZEM6_9BILA